MIVAAPDRRGTGRAGTATGARERRVSVEPSRPLSQTRTGSRTPRAASRARSRCALYEALRRTRDDAPASGQDVC